jgi:hypothetical protein
MLLPLWLATAKSPTTARSATTVTITTTATSQPSFRTAHPSPEHLVTTFL